MRISRVVSVLAVSSLLGGLVAVPSQAEQATTRPLAPAVIQGTPAQLLQEIPVTEPLTVGYRAGLFLSPAELKKKDKRGCTYRNQMLIKLATKKPKVGAGCKLSGGEWLVDFGLKTVKSASQVKLGKLLPDKFVYAQGAYGWTSEQRRAYATSSSTVAKTTRSVSRGLLNENNIQPLTNSGLKALTLINNVIQPAERPDDQVAAELEQIKKAFPGIYESWTVATLLNAKAWGISFSTPVKNESYVTIQQCSSSNTLRYGNEKIEMRSPDLLKPVSNASSILNLCKNTYVVVNQATRYNIKPVPEFASAVPPTNEKVLSSYGAPQGAPIDRHLFGIHAPADWVSDVTSGFDGPIKEATIPNVPVGYLRLWDTETTWADLEPSNGNYVWRKLDKQIEMAQILDADVMMVLGGTPAWAGDGSPQSNPKNIDDWREYVFNVCKRYGAGIRSFEVWNEANLQTFWKGTAVEMADLTKAAFEEIRRCGSGALVVAANTTSRATGSFGTFYPAYLEALKERNWPVDAYSVHSYPTASGGADDRIKGIGQFRTMLALAGAPQTTVFDSEINYGLAGLGEGKVDLSGQTAMTLISRTYIDSARYGFGSTFWFVWTANPDSKFGIQFTRNASAERQAWNTTYDWLVGAQFQRCYETEISVIVCQFNKGASNFSIVWRGDVGSPTQETPVGYFSGLGSQVCDLFGQCTSVTSQSTTLVGPMPRRIDGPPSGTGPATKPSAPSTSTLAPQPPVIIGNPTVTYTTANTQTLNLAWGPAVVVDGSAVIQETGYEYQVVFCGKSQSTCAGKQPERTGVAPAGLQSVDVRVTEGPGVYLFRVRALNGSAASTWTETPILVRSTRALPPEFVRASFNTESNEVQVSWDAPRVALSKIDYYEIELNAINPSRPWGSVKFTSKSPSFSKTLKELGLSPTTTVKFRVRTVLTSGLTSIFETSNELTFRDDLPAPEASAAIIDVASNDGIVLPEGGVTAAAAWQIRVSSDGGASWQIVPCGAARVANFYSFTCSDGLATTAASALVDFGKMGITTDFNTLVEVRYVNADRTSASPWGMYSSTIVGAQPPTGTTISSFPANARPTTVFTVTRVNGAIASYGGTNAG